MRAFLRDFTKKELDSSRFEKGFTLVEILVVVSLILISIGIAGDLIVSVTRSYSKTRAYNEIEQNGNYVIAKLTYDLKNATTVSQTATNNVTVNTTYGSFTYTIQSLTSCSGYSVNTITRRVLPSGTATKMTNDACTEGVHINSTNVFTITTTPVTSVTIALPLRQSGNYTSGSPYTASQTYNTTVTIRGGN